MFESLPLTWNVTVEEVSALAPHVPIGEAPASSDEVFGGRADRRITEDQVEQWITDVSARADVALARRSELTGPNLDRVGAAVHDLVVNGAASYLVAAAFPAKAGMNDNTSYSAQLWDRFMSGLAAQAAVIEELIVVAPGGPGALGISGFFPEPRIPDSLRW